MLFSEHLRCGDEIIYVNFFWLSVFLCTLLVVCYVLDGYVRRRLVWVGVLFFFQAEDGIRALVRSRGLGDGYKRQPQLHAYGSVLLRTAPFSGAVTGLSYPSTPDFSRCQYRQPSP